MTQREIAIEKLRECDLINDEILKLRKKESLIRSEISSIKKSIEDEGQSMVGRNALCSNPEDPQLKNRIYKCTGVICGSDFLAKPLFNAAGMKVKVDFIEWV